MRAVTLLGGLAALAGGAYLLSRPRAPARPVTTTVMSTPESALTPVETRTLDSGLTADEVRAIDYALRYEDDPKRLYAFASTLLPTFPIAASLLRAKAGLKPGARRQAIASAGRTGAGADPKAIHPSVRAAMLQTGRNIRARFGPREALKVFAPSDPSVRRYVYNLKVPLPQALAGSVRARGVIQRPSPPRVQAFDIGDVGDFLLDTVEDVNNVLSDVPGLPPNLAKLANTAAETVEDARRAIEQIVAAIGEVVKDVGEAAAEIGKVLGPILKLIAPVVGLIPGIGSGVAVMLSAAGSLAVGEPLDEAVLNALVNAIPGGGAAKFAIDAGVTVGKGIVEGKRFTDIAMDTARNAAIRQLGPLGGAAFDASLAIARGKTLQEAGFRTLAGWVRGSDLAEKAVNFSERVARAAEQGKSVKDVLIDEGMRQLSKLPLADRARVFNDAIQRLVQDPALLARPAEDVARELGVPVEAVEAAIMNVAPASGEPNAPLVVDPEVRKRFESVLDLQKQVLEPVSESRAIAHTVDRPGIRPPRPEPSPCDLFYDARRLGLPPAVVSVLERRCDESQGGTTVVAIPVDHPLVVQSRERRAWTEFYLGQEQKAKNGDLLAVGGILDVGAQREAEKGAFGQVLTLGALTAPVWAAAAGVRLKA
jgi:hypothetical protein